MNTSLHSIFAVGVIISPVFDFMLERDFKSSDLYLLSIEIHKRPRKCHTSRNQLVERVFVVTHIEYVKCRVVRLFLANTTSDDILVIFRDRSHYKC